MTDTEFARRLKRRALELQLKPNTTIIERLRVEMPETMKRYYRDTRGNQGASMDQEHIDAAVNKLIAIELRTGRWWNARTAMVDRLEPIEHPNKYRMIDIVLNERTDAGLFDDNYVSDTMIDLLCGAVMRRISE